MKPHDDLPLFSWRPPACTVIPFPTSKRVGHIRRTADRVHYSRTQKEADAYWHRAMDGLARQMERASVPAERIEAELTAFRSCVQAELHRLAAYAHRPGGDVA